MSLFLFYTFLYKGESMNNNYITLTAMYRYGILYMADKPTPEQIKHTLTTTNPHTVIPGSKMIVKKALNDNYGIKDRTDMERVITELMNGVWLDSIVYTALIDLFLNNSDSFLSVTRGEAEVFLSSENRLQKYQEQFVKAWQIYGLEVDQIKLTENLKEEILSYFIVENNNSLEYIENVFQRNQTWLMHTNGLSMSAFQLSRVISIITDSCICNYISEDETEKMLNHYGAITEFLFRSWETFLFSAILGKQLMSASGTFILDSADYIQSCYKLAAHPANILELAGLQLDCEMTRFCACLKKEYDLSLDKEESEVGESDPLVSFVQATVLPIFEKYGVEYLFDQSLCSLSYTVPTADTTSGNNIMMEYEMKKPKFEYGADEIPFMVNGKKLLVTNKKIYLMEKKLFSKKIHIFNWTDQLKFSYKFSGLDLVLFMVNDTVLFTFPRNYQKLGISMMADSQFDKKEVMKHYGEDIENALLAFAELKQVLSAMK